MVEQVGAACLRPVGDHSVAIEAVEAGVLPLADHLAGLWSDTVICQMNSRFGTFGDITIGPVLVDRLKPCAVDGEVDVMAHEAFRRK